MSELMRQPTSRTVRSRAQEVGEQCWHCLKRASVCRQCGSPTNPLARVCQHCGTGNPVKIGVSPQLLFTAVVCEIVLVFLNLHLV